MTHHKIEVLKALARVHLDVGQHEAAQKVCRQLLRRNPKDRDAVELMREALAQEASLAENIFEESGDEESNTELRHRTRQGKRPQAVS